MGMKVKYDRSQFTPRNLVLVGGLSLVLLYLVFGGAKPKTSVSAGTDPGQGTSTTNAQRVSANGANRDRDKNQSLNFANRLERAAAWDRLPISLAVAEKNDPFGRLDHAAELTEQEQQMADAGLEADAEAVADRERLEAEQAERAQRESAARQANAQQLASQLAKIESQKIDAVFKSGGVVTALIGSKAIREGDLLSDGIRVVRITAKGMTVAVEAGATLPDESPAIQPPPNGRSRIQSPVRER